jgi:hypothetical protein
MRRGYEEALYMKLRDVERLRVSWHCAMHTPT